MKGSTPPRLDQARHARARDESALDVEQQGTGMGGPIMAQPAAAGAAVLPLGHGAAVALDRVVALANPRSAPVQRLAQQAEAAGRLLDLTFGRRTRAVLLLDSGHVVLASLSADTVLGRWAAAAGGLAKVAS